MDRLQKGEGPLKPLWCRLWGAEFQNTQTGTLSGLWVCARYKQIGNLRLGSAANTAVLFNP